MPTYQATVQDTATKQFFIATQQADNEEEAISELKSFYAEALDTAETYIAIIKINKLNQ